MPNLTSVTYRGARPGVGKDWNRRRYTFLHSKPVFVPDEFAARLLKSTDFIRSDDIGLAIDQRFPSPARFLFRRWGALGDLIMLRAAVASWKRRHPGHVVTLRCQAGFVNLFVNDPLWSGIMSLTEDPVDPTLYDDIISFDQVAEGDHRGDERHRVELFWNMLSKEHLELTNEDWRLPVPNDVQVWVSRHMRMRGLLREQRGTKRLVAVQVHGSHPVKSLPQDVMLQLVKNLAQSYHVMLIEPNEVMVRPFAGVAGVHAMCNRDALHGIEMLRHVDVAVTFDSGPLWMAHSAPCPVVAIMGPTRPAQRISLHPMYPDRAKAVCLNELLDPPCPACFESQTACNRTAACMQKQRDWSVVISQVTAAVTSVIDS